MASNDVVPKTGKGLIVCFGEMLIDLVPTVSGVSLAEAPGFLKAPRGAPANGTIALSRLGGSAEFIGKLGKDEFGHMLAGILKNGIRGDGINGILNVRTALAFVTLRRDGEREFMFYRNPSADMLLHPRELNLPFIRSISALKAMEVAKDAGCLLSYDPNLRLPLWPSPEEAREKIMSIWDMADVIKVNDAELEFLNESHKIDDASALSLWHPNLKLFLVTLSEHGCRYYTENFHGTVETYHVNTVDTTGAGDSFVGALLCKVVDDQFILEDEPRLREVLKFANACGALTTTQKGAIPALPTEAEVLSLIKGTEPSRPGICNRILSFLKSMLLVY